MEQSVQGQFAAKLQSESLNIPHRGRTPMLTLNHPLSTPAGVSHQHSASVSDAPGLAILLKLLLGQWSLGMIE